MKPSSLVSTPKVSACCPVLNRFLSGGIPCNSITEIVGESGSGKTQLCLQLLLSAQLLGGGGGGGGGSSLYLYTEFPFPHRRLRQLSLSFLDSHKPHFGDPLDRVLVHAINDAHHLFDVLLKLDSFLVRRNSSHSPVKLIVIDSIAAVFRSDFDNTPLDLKKRSCLFFKISGKLRALAHKFGLAVVVTNQVVDFVANSNSNSNGNGNGNGGLRIGNLACLYTSGRRVCPALGLAWANCVNTRLFMSRNEVVVGGRGEFVEEDGSSSVCVRSRRHIHVVLAPHLPPSSCEYAIRREGVFGVEPSDEFVASTSHDHNH